MTQLVARSPVHVGDLVQVLVLTQTFWNGIDYHVAFSDNQELRLVDISTSRTPDNASLPAWVTQRQFVSSKELAG